MRVVNFNKLLLKTPERGPLFFQEKWWQSPFSHFAPRLYTSYNHCWCARYNHCWCARSVCEAESGPRARLQVLQNSASRMFMLSAETLSARSIATISFIHPGWPSHPHRGDKAGSAHSVKAPAFPIQSGGSGLVYSLRWCWDQWPRIAWPHIERPVNLG